ncbi:DUF934 domain-containing protein [Paucibacter sp. Y2R2-4]|uniref:DUF934 domain-containing protein n=1 Tax=Paucibacter sp. Y2R2-4 TaxID=2893553 RepID=UPI0021E4C488|nr:DUF934 domain-containing protein [Paucibacter sp. Y2R2-4]MCV2349284.1 DUF934 domain-containing protein [Paucibacter sp. Y2R2-4]
MKFIDTHHQQWHRVVGEDGPMPHPDPAPNLLLTIEQWHAVRDHWPAGLATGVEVPNDFAIEDLAADLPRLSLIALHFPKWVDGRAYSQARLLRSRYRFAGEVRATGEVLVDMLPLLARTGFDAVQLGADQSRASAERALAFFPAHYQGDVDATQPVFARGAA